MESRTYDWIRTLPTFQSLEPPISTSSLPKPFSLFGLFKSTSKLPSPDSVFNLVKLAETSHLHRLTSTTDIDNLDQKDVLKALNGFQGYISQLQSIGNKDPSNVGLGGALEHLVNGYLAVVFVACHAGTKNDGVRILQVAQDALQGVFILRENLSQGTHQALIDIIDHNILASLFNPTCNFFCLTPLITISREIIDNLAAANRTFAKSSPQTTPISSPTIQGILNLLKEYSQGLRNIAKEGQGIGIVGNGKTKEEKALAVARGLRIAMEVDLLQVELAMGMTNLDMGNVKSRAGALVDVGVAQRDRDGLGDVSPRSSTEENVKPDLKAVLDPEDDEISIPDEDQTDEEAVSSDSMQERLGLHGGESSVKWEESTETLLKECLHRAANLHRDTLESVLTEDIRREDWLGHLPEEIPLPETPGTKNLSLKDDEQGSNAADSDDDEDEEENSEASEDPEDEEDEVSHPCSLRTLFSLYDRFEEQRLAIWTSLPSQNLASKSRRKDMEAYMRGTNGEVGKAWDKLGQILLGVYDSQALISYGFSYDKLDRWNELAAEKSKRKSTTTTNDRKRKSSVMMDEDESTPKKSQKRSHRKTVSVEIPIKAKP